MFWGCEVWLVAIYIPARMTVPMNTNGLCSFLFIWFSFMFVLDDVSVKFYGIGDYCLFQFGFIVSDDIFVTDDGNGIGVLLGAWVPSVRLPW